TLAKEQLLDWQNLDKYTEEVATLEAEKDFYQTMEVRMEAAKRASNLQSQDALCIRLKEQLEAAEQTEKQVVVEAEQVKTQFLHAKNQKEALAEKEAELEINKRTLIQLEEMEPKILELETVSIQKRRTELDWKETTTHLEKIIDKEQKIATELQSVEARLAEINKAELTYLEVINKRTTLEARVEKEQELVNKRIKMEEWDAAKQTEEQTLAQLLIEKAEMERTIKQEETKLEKEQAATIAAHLHEGDACPVCGSQSHPVLAKFGETADLETLEIAKAKLQEKQLVITTTEKAISQLEWQLNEWADMKEQSLAEIQQTLAENIQLATNLREQIIKLQSEV
ncbi:SMC family ATPase, partial [Listeria monocytogenes]|nr:SMC family ATPase [Listeria monocytogenes]